jgi:hypothetical protein
MPRVSAPSLISESKTGAQQKAPALEAATKAAETTTTPRRTRRKTSAQNAPSEASTTEVAPRKAKTTSKAQKPTEPAGEGPPAAEAVDGPARENRKPELPPEPDGIPGAKRITLPLWYDLWKKLRRTSVEDEIDTTIVIRSAIELYFHDDRFRAKVDKLAKIRASSIHRGRPRKDAAR